MREWKDSVKHWLAEVEIETIFLSNRNYSNVSYQDIMPYKEFLFSDPRLILSIVGVLSFSFDLNF